MVEKKTPALRRSEPIAAPAAGSRTVRLQLDEAPETIRIALPSERREGDAHGPLPDLTRTPRLGTLPLDAGDTTRVMRPKMTDPPKSVQGVDVVVVDEHQVTGGERRPWRAAEVWTKRRVYGLDSTFRCIEVLDRQTGRPEPTHEMLGARLGGGRLRDKETVRFSYPLPLPGMEAMFSKNNKHGYTSAVEKMVVRIRVLHTSADEASPSWDDIASRWSEPPSG